MNIARWLMDNGFWIAYVLQAAIVLSVLIGERKQPGNAAAWAFLVTILPGVGYLLYLLVWHVSGMRHPRRGRKRFAVEEGVQRALRAAAVDAMHVVDCDRETARLIRNQNDSPCTGDNRLEVLVDAARMYPRLLGDIEAASGSIHVMFFIYERDEMGTAFRDLLARKAREGVEVRLMVDRLASILTPLRFFRPIVEAGGEVHRYLPTLGGNLRRINHRNHRKLVVIDGCIGYTGGINMGDDYLGAKPKVSPWRDTQIRVHGSAVAAMQQRFLLDWAFVGGRVPGDLAHCFPDVASGGRAVAQFVTSDPEQPKEEIKFAYMKLIAEARRSVYVQTPYFAPDDPFLDALYLASATGVDVRVMIPAKPDKRYAYWATLSHVEDLLRRGIRVFRYPGFLHAKMLVTDGSAASIGTANVDVRSFALDFESCMFGYDEAFAGACERVFRADEAASEEVRLEAFRERSRWQRAAEAVMRVLRPLI